VSDIGPAQVRQLLESIAAKRGRSVLAARVRSVASRIFAYACSMQLIQDNPVRLIRLRSTPSVKDRGLSHDEIKAFWRSLDDEGPVIAGLFGLLLLTGQRPEQIMSMRWADVTYDVWTVTESPCVGTKAYHKLYLAPAAQQLLRRIRDETEPGEFVFRSPRGSHITYIRKAARRLNARMRTATPWTPLDLRRTVETGLRILRVRSEVIELILGRKTLLSKLGVVRGDSANNSKIQAAMNLWARHAGPPLSGVPTPTGSRKVVKLVR
jgi:integrase